MRDQGPHTTNGGMEADDGMHITMHDDLPEPFQWIDDCVTAFRRFALIAAIACIALALTAFSIGYFAYRFI